MFAEAWRLGRRCVFWWQARHLQPQLRFAWPAGRFQYEQRCLRKRGPGTPPRFVVPGVILAATQPRFAWPAWHFQYEHYNLIDVCGSVAPGTPLRFLVVGATLAAPQLHFACLRGAVRTNIDVCGSVALGTPPRFQHNTTQHTHTTFSTSGSICVAGVVLSVRA